MEIVEITQNKISNQSSHWEFEKHIEEMCYKQHYEEKWKKNQSTINIAISLYFACNGNHSSHLENLASGQ